MLQLAALLLVLFVTSPAAGAAPAADLPARDDPWTRVETANFTLYGDAAPSKIREVGLELERLRAVLARAKPGGAERSPVPITVYVFQSPAALAPYLPRRDGRPMRVAAYFQSAEDGGDIVLSAGWNSDPRPVVYHEYIHQFLRANFPPLPAWYEEGVAELYSTFRTDGDQVQIGRVRDDLLARLRAGSLIPVERLLAIDHDSPELDDAREQGVFYAESWALVHYLTRSAERAPQLARYLGLLRTGRPRGEAFREAFGEDFRDLQAELAACVRGDSFGVTTIALTRLRFPREARVEPLSYEDAVYRLGELLARGDEGRLADAENHFRAVLASRPAHAGALGGMARIRLRQGRPADAEPLLRRAAETGSADFRVHFWAGRLRMDALLARPGAAVLDAEARGSLEAARAAFRRSIALDPDFAAARVALGRTYLLEDAGGAPSDEGIAALEEAHRRLPAREDVAMDLAQLYDRRGEHDKAERVAGGIGPEASRALQGGRKFGEVIEGPVREVNRLLEQGRDADALALLDGFIERIGQEDVRAEMVAQREALRTGVARNRAIAAYNAAIELYNRRDYAEALPAFERLAGGSPDGEIATKAARMAEEIRRTGKRTSP